MRSYWNNVKFDDKTQTWVAINPLEDQQNRLEQMMLEYNKALRIWGIQVRLENEYYTVPKKKRKEVKRLP